MASNKDLNRLKVILSETDLSTQDIYEAYQALHVRRVKTK